MNRHMLLSDLLDGLSFTERYLCKSSDLKNRVVFPLERIKITHITQDSREVIPGSLFFATKGDRVDGRQYIQSAVSQGAVAIIADADEFEPHAYSEIEVPIFLVENSRQICAFVAARFFGNPTVDALTIGVTGTNGKTSVSWIIAQALGKLGKKASYLGTLGFQVFINSFVDSPSELISTKHTTPDAVALNSFLARAKNKGACAHVLEVSSHAMAQNRIAGVHWDAAVFTNLTRDHLDYHSSMEDYGKTKLCLFTDALPASDKQQKTAAINIDDPFGRIIVGQMQALPSKISVITYSAMGDTSADVYLTKCEGSIAQTSLEAMIFGKTEVFSTKLVGEYNISNILASCACLIGLGISSAEVISAIKQVPTVPGRLELVNNADFCVFIDYAHTPDGLTNVQQSLLPLTSGRLITVFGCGGERDRGKRPLMGASVREWSDYAVVTTDNPRSEVPEKIIEDILPGLTTQQRLQSTTVSNRRRCAADKFHYTVIVNRAEAIAHALAQAQPGDVVLIAGKGHENYQEINGIRYPFCDRDVVRQLLNIQ